MHKTIIINPTDNVAVALSPLTIGETVACGNRAVTTRENIAQGHKIALMPISKDEVVIKYGYPIGIATENICEGEHVHIHNMKTALKDQTDELWEYKPEFKNLLSSSPENFMGYERDDGRTAVRNELWIIPGVGCVNGVCEKLAALCAGLAEEYGIDGVYAFPHPYGCSQTGNDLDMTRRFIASLANHPNAGGVLIVGLGCENNVPERLKEEIILVAGDSWNPDRVRFMVCQEEENELETGAVILRELAVYAAGYKRKPVPVSKLVIGMKCGGSDGLSGITANPLLGMLGDMLVARGGSVILTEVPEMFGAEEVLLNRCENAEVFEKAVDMLLGFRNYFTGQDQPVYENPAPGNYEGGISSLEEKSLGCVLKGGHAPIVDVIEYGNQIRKNGLTLLSGPGSDLVSSANLAAAGAHIVFFSTGRGTPYGTAVPTVKLSSNTSLFEKKGGWIDFNAGSIADGESLKTASERLYDYLLRLASGEEKTKSEINGYREIQIFKNGVTL